MSEQRDGLFEMKGQYTPENSALVLIDHQVGTLQFVHTMLAEETLRNAVMLAKAAKAYGMPIVLTSSQEDHLQGLLAPALQQLLPGIQQSREAHRDCQRMGRRELQQCGSRDRS